jgi:hypothetical protein
MHCPVYSPYVSHVSGIHPSPSAWRALQKCTHREDRPNTQVLRIRPGEAAFDSRDDFFHTVRDVHQQFSQPTPLNDVPAKSHFSGCTVLHIALRFRGQPSSASTHTAMKHRTGAPTTPCLPRSPIHSFRSIVLTNHAGGNRKPQHGRLSGPTSDDCAGSCNTRPWPLCRADIEHFWLMCGGRGLRPPSMRASPIPRMSRFSSRPSLHCFLRRRFREHRCPTPMYRFLTLDIIHDLTLAPRTRMSTRHRRRGRRGTAVP